jgi:hypothetical protein
MALGIAIGWQVENVNGTPVSGAKIYTYRRATTTALAAYTDSAITVPAANPVIADAAGWFNSYLNPALDYTVVIKSADESITYQTRDYFASTGAGSGGNPYTVVDTLAELVVIEGDDSEDTVLMLGRGAAGDGGSGFFRWVTGDQSANVTTDPGQGIWVAPTSASTGASGAWQRIFDGQTYDSRWFGVKSDNATNDNAAMLATLAASAGNTLVLPAGTTLITLAADDEIWYTTTAANTRIIGQGKDATILKIRAVNDTTAYHTFIRQSHANLVLEDLQILLEHENTIANNGDGTVSGGWVVIDQNADRPVFRRVRMDGGITEQGTTAGGDLAPTFNVFVFDHQGNDARIGQYTEQCDFIRCSRTILENNVSTATITGMRSVDDTYDLFYSNAWEVNQPSGLNIDCALIRPRFGTHNSPDLERYGFWIALAGAQGCLIDSPTFMGRCQIAIHIEENSYDVTIANPKSGPDFECLKFLEVLENDIAGSTSVPERITVINPQITTAAYTGTGNTLGGTDQKGIEAVAEGDASTRPFESFQIIGGYLTGFEYGIYDNVNGGGSSLVVDGTMLDSTDTNYWSNTPSPFVQPVHYAGATTHIYAARGGVATGHRFIECAPIIVAAASHGLGLRNWSVLWRDVTVGNSASTYFDFALVDSTSLLEGTVEASITLSGGTGYGYERRPCTWDGTTSVATAGSIFASGATSEGGSMSTAIAHPSGAGADARSNAFAARAFTSGAAGQRSAASIFFTGTLFNEF